MGLVRAISSSSLAKFRCRRGNIGLGVRGRGRRVIIDAKTTRLAAMRGIPKTRDGTMSTLGSRSKPRGKGRTRKRLVGSPLIKAFCTTPSRRTTPFITINSRISGKRAITVMRTVGLVGSVRYSFSNIMSRMLIGGKRAIRCKRPLFQVT